MTQSSKTSTSSNLPLLSNQYPFMSEKVAPFPSPSAQQPMQNVRKLAWQVAPNLLTSFKYAWAGVHYAFITQRNFRIHSAVSVLATSLGVFLRISTVEMAVIAITCAMVMVLELLNTAIESVVDLTVKQSYHELAKIAKDCAAGAVLISAMAAVIVASCILLPPLFALIIPHL